MTSRSVWAAVAVVIAVVLLVIVLVLNPFSGTPAGSGSPARCSASSFSRVRGPDPTAVPR